MDKEWTGTFTIAEVCGKGLYSLKNAMERFLKRNITQSSLKYMKKGKVMQLLVMRALKAKLNWMGPILTMKKVQAKRDQM